MARRRRGDGALQSCGGSDRRAAAASSCSCAATGFRRSPGAAAPWRRQAPTSAGSRARSWACASDVLVDLRARRPRRHQRGFGIVRDFARQPLIGRAAGDADHIGAGFAGQCSALGHPVAARAAARRCRPPRQARDCRTARSACAAVSRRRTARAPARTDSSVRVRPRSPGMNCAMPSAPAGLMVLDRKLLSCQIRLAKNVIGRSLACATATMALHKPPRDSRCSAPAPASIGVACRPAKAPASSAFQPSLLATAASARGGQRGARMDFRIGERPGGGHRSPVRAPTVGAPGFRRRLGGETSGSVSASTSGSGSEATVVECHDGMGRSNACPINRAAARQARPDEPRMFALRLGALRGLFSAPH